MFSSDEQCQRYYSSFSNRVILDPKYLDLEFFQGDTFDCYQVFQNSKLIDFMSLKISYYPELVRVFYNNLKIRDGVIFYTPHKR